MGTTIMVRTPDNVVSKIRESLDTIKTKAVLIETADGTCITLGPRDKLTVWDVDGYNMAIRYNCLDGGLGIKYASIKKIEIDKADGTEDEEIFFKGGE